MKKPNNWENVKASGDFETLPAGGYICRIASVHDEPGREYLKLEYDIADGEYKDYWKDRAESFGWWGGNFYRSYKDNCTGMFKAFTNAVEESNNGYAWEFKEGTLIDKLVGLVLGEEEYIKNNGSVGTRLYVKTVKSVDDIKNGKFKVPEKRFLESETPSTPSSVHPSNDDIPF